MLDEPSIGLHAANVDGLIGVMRDLVADGNSVVVVDHHTRVLEACDHLVEMGPGAGANGGRVIAQGAVGEVAGSAASRIAPFLHAAPARVRPCVGLEGLFDRGRIALSTNRLHTVAPLEVQIPRGRLVAVTGVSGSGKTTLVLEELLPALAAASAGAPCPHACEASTRRGLPGRASSTRRPSAPTCAPP